MPLGLRAPDLAAAHDAALSYEDYLATDPERAERWRDLAPDVRLTPEQTRLVEGFTRRMPVLCISGIWCGDCVRQGPVLQRIAEANPCIDLRFIDRDTLPELVEQVRINDGARVPVTLFMAEDFEPVSVMGDRTLSYYRHMAQKRLEASCPVPGAPTDDSLLDALVADWLDEFERVHLLLRLSGRLRTLHGD